MKIVHKKYYMLILLWAYSIHTFSQKTALHHSIGVEYAPVLFSTGDKWGNSLRLEYSLSFGQKENFAISTSLSGLQKAIDGTGKYFSLPEMSAHYLWDITPRIGMNLLGGSLSLSVGYGIMWGNEMGKEANGIRAGLLSNQSFYIVNPSSDNIPSTLRNIVYSGMIYKIQYEHPLNEKIAIGVDVRIAFLKYKPDTIISLREYGGSNQQINTFGLILKYIIK